MNTNGFFQGTESYELEVLITPELAKEWLKFNTRNRKFEKPWATFLSRQIIGGWWHMSHQGIAFTRPMAWKDGSHKPAILDGQHRLSAVVMAGIPVMMRVRFNEPPEMMSVVDVGKIRSLATAISLGGDVGDVSRYECTVLQAMIAFSKHYPKYRRSPDEMAELFKLHGPAVRWVVGVIRSQVAGVTTAETKAVLARALYSANEDELARFGRALVTGDLDGADLQPVSKLLRYMMRQRYGDKHGRDNKRTFYLKIERALVGYLRGETVTHLYASPGEMFPLPEETGEMFPLPEEMGESEPAIPEKPVTPPARIW